jgi:hypothetical protein
VDIGGHPPIPRLKKQFSIFLFLLWLLAKISTQALGPMPPLVPYTNQVRGGKNINHSSLNYLMHVG